MMELHGGFLHYGVTAYPKVYKNLAGVVYGDDKLIEGYGIMTKPIKGIQSTRR